MSLLPCAGDLVALGIAVGRSWDLVALGEHIRTCLPCAAFYKSMAAAMGAWGGRAGRGVGKRRGSSAYYRRLVGRRERRRLERKTLRSEKG